MHNSALSSKIMLANASGAD